jgi:hypothetical protein
MSEFDKAVPGARRKVVRRGRRINRWNAKRRQTFLAVLSQTANVKRAAERAKMSLPSAYDLKKRDPAFAAAWRAALETGYSELELSLIRQSIEGSERIERVEIGAERALKYVKTVRSYPFAVAMWLLRAHRAEVLAQREAEGRQHQDEDVGARVRAHMDLVRARLLGAEDRLVLHRDPDAGADGGADAGADGGADERAADGD